MNLHFFDPNHFYVVESHNIFTETPKFQGVIESLKETMKETYTCRCGDVQNTAVNTKWCDSCCSYNQFYKVLPEHKSTYIKYKLECGCSLRQRVDYHNSNTKRVHKTVISRIYMKNENQPMNNTHCEYLQINAVPTCKEHWPGAETTIDTTKADSQKIIDALNKSRERADRLRVIEENLTRILLAACNGDSSPNSIAKDLELVRDQVRLLRK